MTRAARRHGGFTLIEVMVAILVFSVMSVMAYRALGGIVDAREHLAAETRRWRELSLFFVRFEADIDAVVNRTVLNPYGQAQPALVGVETPVSDTDGQLTLTRMGLPGTAGFSAGLQRIAYRLHGDAVELLVWPGPDAAPRSVPATYTLIAGVSALDLRYLDKSQQWQTRWGPPGLQNTLPLAVRVELSLATGEKFTRVFALPAGTTS